MPRKEQVRRKAAGETANRATELQSMRRVEELLRIRLDGAEFWDVRDYVREKVEEKDPVWPKQMLSDGQLRRYLQQVDALIAESCKEDREIVVNRHLAQRRSLYARAVNGNDCRTALSILRDEAELLDLYPDKIKKVALTGADGGSIEHVVVYVPDNSRDARHPPPEGAAGAVP